MELEQLTIISFNGHDLETDYIANFDLDVPIGGGSDVLSVPMLDMPPAYGGKRLGSRYIPLRVYPRSGGSGSVDQLKTWLDPYDLALHKLVVRDASSGLTWQVDATCVGTPVYDFAKFDIGIYIPNPIWETVNSNTTYFGISGSSASLSLTSAGNQDAYPVIRLTPLAYPTNPTGTYNQFGWVGVYNPTPYEIPLTALEVFGGLNTLGMVTGSQLLPSGYDLIAIMDGLPTDLYLANYTGTYTKGWINISFKPKVELTLGVAIANSGIPSTITFADTKANNEALTRLSYSGCIRINNEEWLYDTLNIKSRTITPTARQQRGTSAASHSIGSMCRWIEHEIKILASRPDATDPEIDVTKRPVFNLSSGTNSMHPYLNSFGDMDTLEAGEWSPALVRSTGKKSFFYNGVSGTQADPSVVMGVCVNGWKNGTKPQAEKARVEWKLTEVAGYTTLNASGRKYRAYSDWPNNARVDSFIGFQYSRDGKTWNKLQEISTPTVSGTWQAWSMSNVSIPTGTRSIAFVVDAPITARDNNQILAEIDTVSLVLVSGSIVQRDWRGFQNNFWLEGTFLNNGIGESFLIYVAMNLNETLEIDTKKKTIKKNGVRVLSSPNLSSKRGTWLRMPMGSNTISYSSPNNGLISGSFSWVDRNN